MKTTILTLITVVACYAFNVLHVDSARYWVRDIDSLYFSAERDSLFISGYGVSDTFVVGDVDTMYFSDTGYVPRPIPASTASFWMGEPGSTQEMLYWRETRITHNMLMDATEVTQGEFKRLMGVCPSNAFFFSGWHLPRDTLPVYGCTLFDAALYCNARSKAEGLDTVYTYDSVQGVPGDSGLPMTSGFPPAFGEYLMDTVAGANGWRLPTEAQWEYVARCGNLTGTDQNWWGTVEDGMDSDSMYDAHGWYNDNAEGVHHAPARKMRSPWGMYDMHGNVREWTSDGWGDWYSYEPLTDPQRFGYLARIWEHTLRGGGIWDAGLLPVYYRHRLLPHDIGADIEGWSTGFRCVRYAD